MPISTSMPKLNTMLPAEKYCAERGMAPFARQATTAGPSLGWPSSQASKRGEERENSQAAMMRNTVPGIIGVKMPMMPSPTHTQPSANSSQRPGATADRGFVASIGHIVRDIRAYVAGRRGVWG